MNDMSQKEIDELIAGIGDIGNLDSSSQPVIKKHSSVDYFGNVPLIKNNVRYIDIIKRKKLKHTYICSDCNKELNLIMVLGISAPVYKLYCAKCKNYFSDPEKKNH